MRQFEGVLSRVLADTLELSEASSLVPSQADVRLLILIVERHVRNRGVLTRTHTGRSMGRSEDTRARRSFSIQRSIILRERSEEAECNMAHSWDRQDVGE